jgi:hypothetical protein
MNREVHIRFCEELGVKFPDLLDSFRGQFTGKPVFEHYIFIRYQKYWTKKGPFLYLFYIPPKRVFKTRFSNAKICFAGHMLRVTSHCASSANAQTVEIAKWEDEVQFENMWWYAGL